MCINTYVHVRTSKGSFAIVLRDTTVQSNRYSYYYTCVLVKQGHSSPPPPPHPSPCHHDSHAPTTVAAGQGHHDMSRHLVASQQLIPDILSHVLYYISPRRLCACMHCVIRYFVNMSNIFFSSRVRPATCCPTTECLDYLAAYSVALTFECLFAVTGNIHAGSCC